MGRELVERPDDGTWWIVETVTEPKMRISRVFTSKAEVLQVDEALLRVGALEVENWAHEDCLHPEYLPRNKLRSESAAIRKAMEALRKKSSHHRIRILAFIQMFVATLILTAIWAVQTNGGMT